MTQYFGFDPGTYQPWAINLQMDALGQPGVARGMQVQPLGTPSMNVQLSTDVVAGDGVCFLPNGGWARIDAVASLGVPSNSSGNTRTDAVVAYVDPTGVSASNISYLSGWGSGFKGNNNQLVLALVNVPNNATSIVGGNIVNNPLAAQAGSSPANFPDGPVGSERADAEGCPPGLFEATEVLITSSATNGQTSFSIPLTTMQRLVPQGRIGGALETGFFAGPNGWYWPKIRGSVSGLLPVTGVDPVGGNITTAAAQTGEAIYASFRYYDFSRDTKVRGGAMFVEKNSPYLVYQGEVVEDRQLGLQQPLWDGPTGGYLLLNPGESVYYTDYVSSVQLPFLGGPGATNNQVQVYLDGSLNSNHFAGAENTPGGQTYTLQYANFFPSPIRAPHVLQLKVNVGLLGIPGLRAFYDANSSVYVSGGVVNVQGQPVLLQSTSFQLPAPSAGSQDSYVVYTDRYGNISASGGTLAVSQDRILGRVPVAAALQYGTPIGGAVQSSSFGQWALPGSYLGWPVTFVAAGVTSASLATGVANGWGFQSDPLSPNGGYLTSATQWDVLEIGAVCTGMDLLVKTAGVTTNFTIFVDSPVNALGSHQVFLAATTQYNVRVTLFSGLPYGTHTVRIQNRTTAAAFGIDAVDIRVPATPAAPPGTVALAQVDVFGYSSIVRPSLVRGTQLANNNMTSAALIDTFRPTAEPAIWLSNTSGQGSNPLVLAMNGTGGFTIHYQAGPDKGIISLNSFSIDCYAATVVSDTTVLVATGGNVQGVTFSGSGLKNASSTGVPVVINAIDFQPWYNFVTDLRHWGVGHGHASELRASSLQTALGGRLDDGGQGIRAEQIRDRGITSRKIAPSWKRTVGSTAFSGFPGIDTQLNTTIVVEVPSVLDISVTYPARYMSNAGATYNIVVDGQTLVGGSAAFLNDGATAGTLCSVTVRDLVPVAAGAHLIQWNVEQYGVTLLPYLEGPTAWPRVLTVLAYAL